MSDKAEKSSLMRGFNDTFFDFIDDAIRIIPNNKDVISARASFNLIKMANPSAIIKVWYQFIYLKKLLVMSSFFVYMQNKKNKSYIYYKKYFLKKNIFF